MAEVVSIITLIHRIASVIPYYVDSGASPWILATGLWNDSGIWSDTDVWID
mgnify:FL=1